MISIARTLLRKNKIVLIDEPTSNIDESMEQMITKTLHEVFKNYTVLTIAHKIQTIMKSDKILVLD